MSADTVRDGLDAQSGYPATGYPGAGRPTAPHPPSGYPTPGYPTPGYPTPGYPTAGYPAAGGAASQARWRRRLPTPAYFRDLAGATMWLSLLIVVALWVSNGGLQALSGGSGNLLTTLGRLTGLVSADLLLFQVLLLARIPFVEQAYGQDELARRHRLVGFTSFNLMLAHLVLIVLGYTAMGRFTLLGQIWDLVANYPGMLLATAAAALLVLVTVTSVRAARKALRYESWHLLHLYAYLGIGLSIPHEIWTGADFIASPASQLYWWTIYALALGAVLVYRIGVPVYRSLRHGLVVHRVVREAPGVVSVYLRGKDLDAMPVSAGQFFTWRFLDGKGWTRGHPYSLSAMPTPTSLRITVKNLGDGSARLAGLRPGTRALIEGPYGRLHGGVRTRRKVTLLASGIGITPLRALLEELPYGPGDVTLIYRARDAKDLVFRKELDQLATTRGARVYYVLGQRARGRDTWLPQSAAHLSDPAALRELVPDVEQHDVYICGADSWMDAAREAALGAGVPAGNIHLERFTW